MASVRTVVVGASAGGVETLIQLCKLLPKDLDAAILIVLHLPATGVSMLPQILTRAGNLPAQHAHNEEIIQSGRIYIAPPNHHILLDDSRLYLSLGPRENGHRPSIDALFRSAAQAAGVSLIGVVLSGTLADGAYGLQEIKRHGGITIVQDPNEAAFSGMPINAIRKTQVDFILSLEEIAKKVVQLVGVLPDSHNSHKNPIPSKSGGNGMDPNQVLNNEDLQADREKFRENRQNTPRTLLTCPDCGGVLWEIHASKVLAYRCQIGHQFSEESLEVAHTNMVESALWAAVRLLEERANLSARIASRAREQGLDNTEKHFRELETDAERTAAIIRNLILEGKVTAPISPPDEPEVSLDPPSNHPD